MSDVIINQSQQISKSYKKVEKEVKNTVNNINVDLSKIDMTGAIDSFKRLEEVSKAASFDTFINKVLTLKETFVSFQKAVQTANTSVTNFSKSADKLQGGQTAIVTNVEFNAGDMAGQATEVSNNVSSNFNSMATSLGAAASEIGGSLDSAGNAAINFGNGIATALGSVSGLIGSVASLINSVASLGQGIIAAASGISMLIPLLPTLGSSLLQMAINMSGILAYLPELIVFAAILAVLALLGEGLLAAGNGLLNIGLGLTSMTEGMSALLAFMPVFIASLAGITENIGGIILFVLLAAALLVMAIAMQMMNEQLTQFVSGMSTLAGLMSVGFVAGFVVFGAMLIGMSFFMGKVADGIQKITAAMTKQCAKLAVLNPLLAAQAILSNPFVGVVTVALAVAGGLLVKALLPAMATGGVVSSPTVAMVGEGRYPEAVVPLGDSPQFSSMKADIANAVLTALNVTGSNANGNNSPIQLTVNLDSKVVAKQLYAPLQLEAQRRG